MLPIEPGRATQMVSVLILAKSNAAVAAISRAARERPYLGSLRIPEQMCGAPRWVRRQVC